MWLDWRLTAVTFLAEAKSRLRKAEEQFDAAMAQHRVVADGLRKARGLVPRTETTWAQRLKFTSLESAQLIREAGAAEGQALHCLQRMEEAP